MRGVELNSFLGKSIKEICPNGYASAADNHCAHFVNHVLGLQFGYTCANATGTALGVNLRVHELFQRCPHVGTWDKRTTDPCICFVLEPGHVHLAQHIMANVPKKHVGIYDNGTVWHYSNHYHKVIKQRPQEFIKHYPHQTNALFYGIIP